MPDLDPLPIAVASVLVFVLSSTYYTLTARQLAAARGPAAVDESTPPGKVALELLRGAVLATVVAGLAAAADLHTWPAGLALGAALWVGFPLVLWSGAVLWEGTSPRLAVLHGLDWLAKLLLVAAVVTTWR
ncbi:MAG TPA: DUF1761 domain-containing protein [Mycobacteriales bacterium]